MLCRFFLFFCVQYMTMNMIPKKYQEENIIFHVQEQIIFLTGLSAAAVVYGTSDVMVNSYTLVPE